MIYDVTRNYIMPNDEYLILGGTSGPGHEITFTEQNYVFGGKKGAIWGCLPYCTSVFISTVS